MNLTPLLITCFMIIGSHAVNENEQKNARTVSAAELKEWVSFLASDEMRGRRNGSPEMRIAASWIAEKFQQYGLKGGLENNGFIQEYSSASRQGQFTERNVIGIIEGSDPELRDQYIILTAHFDHIGIRKGNPVDSICNGADDNASGTCTLIGIARSIMNSEVKPGRSVIFAAFSGEESGMRGSRYFVSSPAVPLKKIVADINFEMTGHSGFLGRNKYYMTGCLNSNLDDIIGEFNKNLDIRLVDTIKMASQLFYSSDNISFSRISGSGGQMTGIPSGTFATSTSGSYLHSVNDEIDLFDFENMANLVNYFSDMVIWLSNTDREIKWTDPKFSRPE